LAGDASHPIFIVTDGYSAHHAKVVNEYFRDDKWKG